MSVKERIYEVARSGKLVADYDANKHSILVIRFLKELSALEPVVVATQNVPGEWEVAIIQQMNEFGNPGEGAVFATLLQNEGESLFLVGEAEISFIGTSKRSITWNEHLEQVLPAEKVHEVQLTVAQLLEAWSSYEVFDMMLGVPPISDAVLLNPSTDIIQ